jgi:hypothetical protein
MNTNNNMRLGWFYSVSSMKIKFYQYFHNHSVHEHDDFDYHITIEVHVHVYHNWDFSIWQRNTIPKKKSLWKLKARKKLRNTKIIQQFNGKQLC